MNGAVQAVRQARVDNRITGFCPVGGKTARRNQILKIFDVVFDLGDSNPEMKLWTSTSLST